MARACRMRSGSNGVSLSFIRQFAITSRCTLPSRATSVGAGTCFKPYGSRRLVAVGVAGLYEGPDGPCHAASNSYTPTNSRMRRYTPGILGNSDADEASAALYVSQTNWPGEFTRIPLLPDVMRALMKPLLALTDSMYLRVVLTISGRVKRREGACIFRVGPTPVRCISATL